MAAILMPASPDVEQTVAAQPLDNLAYQVLGDPNALEIVTAPDTSLAARNAFRSTSQLGLAAPPILLQHYSARKLHMSWEVAVTLISICSQQESTRRNLR